MKKLCFKVLCMVLIIALLAPNAFAATPTPEIPLADAATVERVKQEIVDGEITDMEDLFLVAYQHLGADLEEEGMTAYINEDGTLGITQIISSEKKMTRSGEVDEKCIATTSLAILGENGDMWSDYEYFYNYWVRTHQNDNGIVYATHTSYFNAKHPYDNGEPVFYGTEVQLNYMVTQIHQTSGTVLTKLVQEYQTWIDDYTRDERSSRTVTNPGVSTYSYTPSQRSWYSPLRVGGGMYSFAEIWISNVEDPLVLGSYLAFSVEGFFFSNELP